ncbi:hypothetical protein DSO57_1000302 [Entomophthora muscae]|uniref:Uncharacterized protein n=1 Tax=Entomophthora muscae TaxID=34485 RepID=A0ACC2TKJ9_9FUNG|nr:hypothetical protein DSO57_1000302 [Entomophthora muscae]
MVKLSVSTYFTGALWRQGSRRTFGQMSKACSEKSSPQITAALEDLKTRKINTTRLLNPFQTELLETSLAELGLPVTLGLPEPGQKLFPHAHSIYFGACTPESGLDSDGYGKAFAPPAPPFSERVISSGRLEFNSENWLEIGQEVNLTNSCNKVTQGFSQSRGNSIAVEQKKVYENSKGLSLTEFRTITYFEPMPRALRQSTANSQTPRPAKWNLMVLPTPVLLFRYSAVTFNAHRIHYDAAYCREVENYPDCLVHGPLTCTLALRLLTQALEGEGRLWANALQSFEYRLLRPLFVNRPFTIKANVESSSAEVWIETKEGLIALKARAQLK